MPVFDRFIASRREAMPETYLVPERLSPVVELLRRQGIALERLRGRPPEPLEMFVVDSITRGPAFEGHHPVRIEGHWAEERAAHIERGWYLVSTAQPLGLLAAYLLEPASEDGVVTWNLLDAELSPGRPYPILRSPRRPAATDGTLTGGPHAADR